MNEFKITRVEREGDTDSLQIRCECKLNDKKGWFIYTLIGEEIGIYRNGGKIFDGTFDYDLIHDWINEHIECKSQIFYDGFELGD